MEEEETNTIAACAFFQIVVINFADRFSDVHHEIQHYVR